MLDKVHVATVFQDGYTRVLIYLDGSIEISQTGKTIALDTVTVDGLIIIREREMLKKVSSIQDRLRASDVSLADWVAGMVE